MEIHTQQNNLDLDHLNQIFWVHGLYSYMDRGYNGLYIACEMACNCIPYIYIYIYIYIEFIWVYTACWVWPTVVDTQKWQFQQEKVFINQCLVGVPHFQRNPKEPVQNSHQSDSIQGLPKWSMVMQSFQVGIEKMMHTHMLYVYIA